MAHLTTTTRWHMAHHKLLPDEEIPWVILWVVGHGLKGYQNGLITMTERAKAGQESVHDA